MMRPTPPPVPCHAIGCDTLIGRGHLFCVAHWDKLPSEAVAGLNALTSGPVEEGYADRFYTLLGAAVTILAAKDGRDVTVCPFAHMVLRRRDEDRAA